MGRSYVNRWVQDTLSKIRRQCHRDASKRGVWGPFCLEWYLLNLMYDKIWCSSSIASVSSFVNCLSWSEGRYKINGSFYSIFCWDSGMNLTEIIAPGGSILISMCIQMNNFIKWKLLPFCPGWCCDAISILSRICSTGFVLSSRQVSVVQSYSAWVMDWGRILVLSLFGLCFWQKPIW